MEGCVYLPALSSENSFRMLLLTHEKQIVSEFFFPSLHNIILYILRQTEENLNSIKITLYLITGVVRFNDRRQELVVSCSFHPKLCYSDIFVEMRTANCNSNL